MNADVTVIGAGLAGSEASWQLAQRGHKVLLYEMRPESLTPAHRTGLFAELVCSNSLRAAGLTNAVGLLKEEMRRLNSLIMEAALKTQVPAGGAMAVDREQFSQYITDKLMTHPNIIVRREEVTEVPEDQLVIVATGPLTSNKLAENLAELMGDEYLYFYDAAAPIVTLESVDFEYAFRGSRYGKGGDDYINCPMTKDEYERFWSELVNAERQPLKEFEQEVYFEGCMPIEEMARRGKDTLVFGPLKPVGLTDPRTGSQPYAVVQLRQDNLEGTLYNMVGFQTHLKWPEQRRVFRLIPALHRAEFVRYGVMHRNTYINAPRLLNPTGQLKKYPNIFIAGQLSGVEGYVESAASGLIAGYNASRIIAGRQPVVFPPETAMGALMNYITTSPKKDFQPMNITFGLLPPVKVKAKGRKARRLAQSGRALEALDRFLEQQENI